MISIKSLYYSVLVCNAMYQLISYCTACADIEHAERVIAMMHIVLNTVVPVKKNPMRLGRSN